MKRGAKKNSSRPLQILLVLKSRSRYLGHKLYAKVPLRSPAFLHRGFCFPLCSHYKTTLLPSPVCKYNAECRQHILLALLVYFLLPHSKIYFHLELHFSLFSVFPSSELKKLETGGCRVPRTGSSVQPCISQTGSANTLKIFLTHCRIRHH